MALITCAQVGAMLTARVDMMGFCMQHRHPSRRDAPPGPQLPAALWLCQDAQGV